MIKGNSKYLFMSLSFTLGFNRICTFEICLLTVLSNITNGTFIVIRRKMCILKLDNYFYIFIRFIESFFLKIHGLTATG